MNEPERPERPVSWWWTTRPYAPGPALEGDLAVDVAVIGGGYTGLSTAWNLKRLEPSLDVAVIEDEAIGFGASGRNAGFGMTLFGLTLSLTRLRFGAARAREAHRYMEAAVDHLWRVIREEGLDCDAERPGFLRVATTPAYAERVRREVDLARGLGIEGIEWLDAGETRRRVASPRFLGAWWEPRCVLLNPAKLAWELRRLAERAGARIFERTRVVEVAPEGGGWLLRTPRGAVRARKVAFATNAFSVRFPQLRAKQSPVYTYIVLTEPLGDRLREIGWAGREGIEDARNLIHYFRLTPDGRLLMGGGDVGFHFGAPLDGGRDRDEAAFAHLERFIPQVFPSLAGVPIAWRWGGPVSVTLDFAPALGHIGRRGDRQAVYAVGCTGHGVSMAQLNGLALAEMLVERRSERTEAFFVDRWTIPWPPEPVRFGLGCAIRGYMRAEDRWLERRAFAP